MEVPRPHVDGDRREVHEHVARLPLEDADRRNAGQREDVGAERRDARQQGGRADAFSSQRARGDAEPDACRDGRSDAEAWSRDRSRPIPNGGRQGYPSASQDRGPHSVRDACHLSSASVAWSRLRQ